MRVLAMAVAAVSFALAGMWGVSSFAAEREELSAELRAQGKAGVAQDDPLAAMAWLAGCWRWQRGGGEGALIGEEQWMSPAGGLMMGMSRTRRGERAVAHEFLRIVERDGVLHYIANPSAQSETVFRAASVADTLAVFENPQHDFPQRIAYQRHGADSLVATISAIAEGGRRPLSFRMARVACP